MNPSLRQTKMKKIIVIGCPGSGKSTFARALNCITGIPLYPLDLLYWNPDKTTVSKEVFRQRLKNTLALDSWIIDGNYGSTMELRLQFCDTVFFLDYATEVCLAGVASRKGKPRPDLPWVETGEDDEFLAFVQAYNTESKPKVIDLLKKYPDKKVIRFFEREESEQFLRNLENTILPNSLPLS